MSNYLDLMGVDVWTPKEITAQQAANDLPLLCIQDADDFNSVSQGLHLLKDLMKALSLSENDVVFGHSEALNSISLMDLLNNPSQKQALWTQIRS